MVNIVKMCLSWQPKDDWECWKCPQPSNSPCYLWISLPSSSPPGGPSDTKTPPSSSWCIQSNQGWLHQPMRIKFSQLMTNQRGGNCQHDVDALLGPRRSFMKLHIPAPRQRPCQVVPDIGGHQGVSVFLFIANTHWETEWRAVLRCGKFLEWSIVKKKIWKQKILEEVVWRMYQKTLTDICKTNTLKSWSADKQNW